jgi:hypothetical protein
MRTEIKKKIVIEGLNWKTKNLFKRNKNEIRN